LTVGVIPDAWRKTKNYPSSQKTALLDPRNYRLLAINGPIYKLYANVVRDLLTEWAIAEKQIPDTQFGFCPTRNTNQPIFILRHLMSMAESKSKKLFTAFVDLTVAYDSIKRKKPSLLFYFKTLMVHCVSGCFSKHDITNVFLI